MVGCRKEKEQEGAARGGLLLHSWLCAFYLVTQGEKGKKKINKKKLNWLSSSFDCLTKVAFL